jgi:hypothetical protein
MAGLGGPASTRRQRALASLLWTGAALLTFVACIEVLAS